MATSVISQVLVAFCAIVALNLASTLPRDITFPTAEENHVENLETLAYPPPVNNQPLQIPTQEDRPKSCFHFFVSRNMSSLLAEATKMLRTIRDRREREWVLTFIYRIKSLAEHLRAHPDSRNYDCLPTDDEETKKRILGGNVREPQPELYFVDDVPKRSIEGDIVPADDKNTDDKNSDDRNSDNTNSNDNQELDNNPSANDQSKSDVAPNQEDGTTSDTPSLVSKLQTQSSAETLLVDSPSDTEQGDMSLSKQDMPTTDQIQETEPLKDGDKNIVMSKKERTDDGSIVLSSAPDCESVDCGKDQPKEIPKENYFTDAGNIYPSYDAREEDLSAAEMYQQEALKERIRKALLEELAPEVKKLRTVGGTEDDLVGLWNSNFVQEDKSMEENEMDFDYEETGAATGDLNLNEKVQPDRTVAPSLDEVQNSKENSAKDSSYEPYDDSDVLVQQLFDVRFNNPPSKTTKSLSDQNNEYLITSTHSPF